ncbi:MAG: hypothetical protein ACYCT7_00095 [bacterium]
MPFHLLLVENYAFARLIVISGSILFGIGMVMIYDYIKNKIGNIPSKIIIFIFIFFTIYIYAFPIWSNKVSDEHFNYYKHKVTIHLKIPKYYKHIHNYLEKNKIDYNIFVVPLSYMRVLYKWHYGYYGSDYCNPLYGHSCISSVVLDFTPQDLIINKIQNEDYEKLFSIINLFTIKYVVIRNDMLLPKFNKFNYAGDIINLKYISKGQLKVVLNNSKNIHFVKKFGRLDLYKVSSKYFLPMVWSPKRLIFVNNIINLKALDNFIVPITMQNSFKVRTAVFAKLFSQNKKLEKLKNYKLNNMINKYSRQHSLTNKIIDVPSTSTILKISETRKKLYTPTIEFKKINPTKYAVIVRNAKENFPIVLNQFYSNGWNLYFQRYPQNSTINNNNKNVNGNKFISKNINGTIQNDNIPSGHILQTLFKKPLPDKYHFVANGYANSWWINLKYIKKLGPQYYKVNKNGTVDFELIIDYWPQRLLYIGLIISGSSFLIIVAYLIYDAIKKRKNKKDIKDIDNSTDKLT